MCFIEHAGLEDALYDVLDHRRVFLLHGHLKRIGHHVLAHLTPAVGLANAIQSWRAWMAVFKQCRIALGVMKLPR
jgi:hypothetical protein